ncbi:MAG TPA: hypothetical protein PKA10_14745 [Selenomonadales bacterium]|nr:hypothetical protein [Selenomonadales bacterium]
MPNNWCEHLDKISKYTYIKYSLESKDVMLRVQTWICPECGVHGAETEIVKQTAATTAAG